LIGERLGNPACGAGIRGLIPILETASFLPYPLASIFFEGIVILSESLTSL